MPECVPPGRKNGKTKKWVAEDQCKRKDKGYWMDRKAGTLEFEGITAIYIVCYPCE